MKRVLVAGATGYLGRFVAKELKSRGYFVRALARSPKKLDPIRDSLDEVVQAEITQPDTLAGVCDGIDVVFSSVGITKQKGNLTFKDVDYQGNRNLLEVAQRAGVKKFIYTSVFRGPNLLHLDIVKAHEDFVTVLKASDMAYTVVRPTGFFSDMGEYLKMARKGRVYLIGKGDNRINPIHGADLADVCADTVDQDVLEMDVGGPEILTHREIARLALEAAEKHGRIPSVPVWVMRGAVSITRIFSRHQGELLAFFTEAMTADAVAPAMGSRSLSDHFKGLVAAG
ncbi:MAG: NAD(P)H-binding protein [Gemmatimonadetes bacterium]|nr:SDR family oxidoreductase [Gemmatimonadota bacterium]NNM03468.1 NAD(P)H-binding protein [Gemmatimonadota bacterium]